MRIVKIGGRAQANPRLSAILADAWRVSPGLCVIHGGGDELSSMQRALGREPVFIGGRRVTSEGDLELLRMVLSGLVNKRLVNMLVATGLPAVGISGEDGGLIAAEPIDKISPVALDSTSSRGGALNVNGDDAAAAISSALEAEELLLIADVEGVRDADGEILSNLNAESARELISSGIAEGGMAAKIESAQAALASGVPIVRICDLDGLLDDERGTFITLSTSIAL